MGIDIIAPQLTGEELCEVGTAKDKKESRRNTCVRHGFLTQYFAVLTIQKLQR